MDEFSGKHDFLINIGDNKAKILYDLLNEEKPQTLVELGGYVGYSAIHFADTMRRYSKPDAKPRVFSLEMKAEFSAIARQLIELAGLSDIVTVVTGPAEESIRKLHKEGTLSNIDFLFIDHVESLYTPDFKACEELGLLKKGAVITADNVVRPGAPEYREFVRSHARLQSSGVKALIQPGDIDVSTSKSVYCSARLTANFCKGRNGDQPCDQLELATTLVSTDLVKLKVITRIFHLCICDIVSIWVALLLAMYIALTRYDGNVF